MAKKARDKPIKVLNTLICNDVRREDSGKMILIGVYNSTIIFPKTASPPIHLKQLTVFMQLLLGQNRYDDIRIAIDGPDGERGIVKGNLKIEHESIADPVIFTFDVNPFQIERFGRYTIRFGVGSARAIYSFDVRQGNVQQPLGDSIASGST